MPENASLLPIVATVLLLLVLALVGLVLLARRRNGWVREAERTLDDLAVGLPGAALAGAAGLLRRVALARIGPDAAKLRGDPWLATLDRLFDTDFFRRGAGYVFGERLYHGNLAPGEDAAALTGLKRLLRRKRLRPW